MRLSAPYLAGRSLRAAQLLFAALLFAACAGFPFTRETKIVFLHLGDIYEAASAEGEGGGLARVKTLLDQEKIGRPNALTIVSGDVLSPSLISSLDQGRLMIQALNMMGTDFAALGNHDFDFGPDVLKERIAESRFQWVAFNILENGGPLEGTVPVAIRQIKGVKVGFIGLMDPAVLDSFSTPRGVDVLAVSEAARRGLNILRQKKADLVVAITHMNIEMDLRLAEEAPGIDLILGGHDHTVLIRQAGKTLIMKSGMNGRFIGKVTMLLRDGQPPEISAEHIEVTAGTLENQHVNAILHGALERLTQSLQTPIGSTTEALDAGQISSRTRETNLGNFIADSMRERMESDAAVINGGAIRSDRAYEPGEITGRDLASILPFTNVLCKIRVNGSVIKEALENSFYAYGLAKGRFLQISGMSVTADVSKRPGERVVNVEINGKPLEEKGIYTLALNDYLLKGGDGYAMFEGSEVLIGPLNGEPLLKAVEKSLAGHTPISPKVDGRIRIIAAP